jgi:hypothetical protein
MWAKGKIYICEFTRGIASKFLRDLGFLALGGYINFSILIKFKKVKLNESI